MSDSAPVSNHGIQGQTNVPGREVTRVPSRSEASITRRAREAEPRASEVDRVELSEGARQMMSKLSDLSPERRELVMRVRREIEAGTYETPERIAGAIRGLAEELGLRL